MSYAPRVLESIQSLRGLAALVVLLFHAAVLSVDYFSGVLFSPWMIISKSGVDLFFVISGFVMVYTTAGTFDKPGSAGRFAISRISRVYPPYWVLTALVFAYWLYNPGGVNAKNGGVDPLSSFLLYPSKSLPLVPVAWTLMHEVFFYGVFWVVMAFGSRRLLLPTMAAWALCSLANAAVGAINPDAMIEGLPLSPFNLEFVAGGLIAAMPRRRNGAVVAFLGVAWFAALGLYFHAVNQDQGIAVPLRVALFLPPCAALVYGAVAMEEAGWRAPRIAAWFGGWSYSLYLVHILVIHLVYRVATRKTSIAWTGFSAATLALTVVVASMVIGFVYFVVVERPLSARMRQLLSSVAIRARLRPEI